MGRTPSGTWFANVEEFASNLSRDASSSQLSAEILRRSSTASPAMAARMAAAFLFANTMARGEQMLASIAAVEQLQAVARLDKMVADEIRSAVIAGNIPASAVRTTVENLRAKASVSPEVLHLPWKQITDRCIKRVGAIIGVPIYDHAMHDSDIVEVDASYYYEDGKDIATYERYAEWALIISPRILCARSKNNSTIDFVRRILISTSIFRFVSVFFSSAYEQNLIGSILRQYPRTWTRIWEECA